MGAIGHGERAADRAQLAGQSELTGELVLCQCVCGNLSRGGQDTKRDRQIEPATLFRQIGRGEINGDASCREIEARCLQRGAYAVFGFFDLGLGQTDDGKGGRLETLKASIP